MRSRAALIVCLALMSFIPAVTRAAPVGAAPNPNIDGGGTGQRRGDPLVRTDYNGTYSSNSQLGYGRFSFDISDDLDDRATFTRADGMTMTGTLDVIIADNHPDLCGTTFGILGTCLTFQLRGTADIASASILMDVLDSPTSNDIAFFMNVGFTLRHRIGYAMVDASGTTYAFGGVSHFGDASTTAAVDIERMARNNAYWVVNSRGQVFAFNLYPYFGSADPTSFSPGERVTSMSSTPTGRGYWLFTNRGRVMRFGDAQFFGDLRGTKLNGNIVGSIATPSGNGYYMVGSDGGVFAFGDARFHGSTGNLRLNKPVVGLVPSPDNRGYWLVASDGGVFSFDAPFHGSMGATRLNQPIVSMVAYGDSYMMVASDGGIFNFSKEPFFGSLAGVHLSAPITNATATG